MSKLTLPRVYEIKDNTPEKYHQYEGLPKLSYSQYTSWRDPSYKKDYILQYFFKKEVVSQFQIFATYGSEVGEFIETQGADRGEMISDEVAEMLLNLEYPENSVYEDEIVLPVYDAKGKILFVIQGFIDRSEYIGDNQLGILDFKTGNVAKKVEYYGSPDYGQTTLYCHCKHLEGLEIVYSKVTLLGRKGNGRQGHPLRLNGENVDIDTPYSVKRGEAVVKDMTKVAKEISDHYKVLLKVRKNA